MNAPVMVELEGETDPLEVWTFLKLPQWVLLILKVPNDALARAILWNSDVTWQAIWPGQLIYIFFLAGIQLIYT